MKSQQTSTSIGNHVCRSKFQLKPVHISYSYIVTPVQTKTEDWPFDVLWQDLSNLHKLYLRHTGRFWPIYFSMNFPIWWNIYRGHCWCSGVLVLELKQCLCCLPFMLDAWFVYSSLEMSDCETQVLQWFGDWALCGGKKYLRLCFCPARPLGWFIKLRQRMTNCTPHYNIQDLISRSLSSCFILDLGCLTVCTK